MWKDHNSPTIPLLLTRSVFHVFQLSRPIGLTKREGWLGRPCRGSWLSRSLGLHLSRWLWGRGPRGPSEDEDRPRAREAEEGERRHRPARHTRQMRQTRAPPLPALRLMGFGLCDPHVNMSALVGEVCSEQNAASL